MISDTSLKLINIGNNVSINNRIIRNIEKWESMLQMRGRINSNHFAQSIQLQFPRKSKAFV